eukprot:Platyproteum_vivax@DN11270_c0_g1_i1.p1
MMPIPPPMPPMEMMPMPRQMTPMNRAMSPMPQQMTPMPPQMTPMPPQMTPMPRQMTPINGPMSPMQMNKTMPQFPQQMSPHSRAMSPMPGMPGTYIFTCTPYVPFVLPPFAMSPLPSMPEWPPFDYGRLNTPLKNADKVVPLYPKKSKNKGGKPTEPVPSTIMPGMACGCAPTRSDRGFSPAVTGVKPPKGKTSKDCLVFCRPAPADKRGVTPVKDNHRQLNRMQNKQSLCCASPMFAKGPTNSPANFPPGYLPPMRQTPSGTPPFLSSNFPATPPSPSPLLPGMRPGSDFDGRGFGNQFTTPPAHFPGHFVPGPMNNMGPSRQYSPTYK